MPDTRSHRGPGPEDEQLFAAKQWPVLRTATDDLCWLLNRAYAARSGLELVGNRYSLTARQRLAVVRSACSDSAAQQRNGRQLQAHQLQGRELWIDGLNVLTGLEVALSGGVILIGRDGCCRDIAGVHRHYRKVQETTEALRLIAEFTSLWKLTTCRWWLDKPVSNSGRLKTFIGETAKAAGWNMPVELDFNPDRVLWESENVIASSDSVVLDRCHGWVNLARLVITERIPGARIVNLFPDEGSGV